MSKYSGYMGKVGKFNLSTGKLEEYPWSDGDRELYLGGKIMAAKILYDNLTGKEEAFSEENVIVISTGPLTGTGAPASNRFNVSAISPLTGIVASSNCGGNFGYYLKKAGYDALVLTGKCSEPCWLEIYNDTFTLHSAEREDVWGKSVSEAQQQVRDLIERDNGIRMKCGVLAIGPAGENLVRYAGVYSDERAASRAGLGAVFGWKNLKAVGVYGNKHPSVRNEAKNIAWNKKWIKALREHPITGDKLPKLGTAGLVKDMQETKTLATRNFALCENPDFEKVSGEALAELNLKKKGCISCPVNCTRTVEVDGKEVRGPELEALVLLGGGIENSDLALINKWNNQLDELGIDPISAAVTLSYAMEANEKGLWNNGFEFGKTEGITELWNDIAYRRGIGDEMAEGTLRLSEKYGGAEFAMQSKGLELSGYEPRRSYGQALGYATANRGGCHLEGGYMAGLETVALRMKGESVTAKPELTVLLQNVFESISATGQCLYTAFEAIPAEMLANEAAAKAAGDKLQKLAPVIAFVNKHPGLLFFSLPMFSYDRSMKYAVGMKLNPGKYLRIGERGYTLERYVDSLFGVSAASDTLPARLTEELADAADENSKVPLEKLKKAYYAARGWNKDGVPTEATLKKLGIKKGSK